MSAPRGVSFLASLMLAVTSLSGAAAAQGADPTLRDSFAIGDQGGALCEVQATVRDPVVTGMFERAWNILCRDAAEPVGQVRILRMTPDAAMAALNRNRAARMQCDGAGACTVTATGVAWQTRIEQRGAVVYAVEGYGAYADALNLAFDSVRDQRVASGVIRVATTSVGADEGFARTLAGKIDVDKALAEGYRRNHAGNYAEAAEFFESLSRRGDEIDGDSGLDPSEFTLNRALQKSNLGEFAEADSLFDAALASPTSDIVQLRLRRNFRAIHALNQQDFVGAIAILDTPLPSIASAVAIDAGRVSLSREVVAGINSGNGAALVSQGADNERLTPFERAIIIDAQATHLRGTASRLAGDAAAAKAAQLTALAQAIAVREGRVTSIVRLRSQMLGELALAEEAMGNTAAARARFDESIAVLAVEYPETAALASARARYAAYLTRSGAPDQARALYRTIVTDLTASRRTTTGMANQMAPYYALLAEQAERDPAAAADFFAASLLQVRPGVADTQAVLARELASGSDEGARLFRQANRLARDIERARIEDARLGQLPPSPEIAGLRADLATRLGNLGAEQAATLVALADFPQFKVVDNGQITLAELQAALKPGEGYAKMLVVGDAVYTMLIEPDRAALWRADISAAGLERAVSTIRASISVVESGRRVTYPFDAAASRKLYGQLFGPVAERLPTIASLIFEPDGAMLKLPVNLLITADTGLADFQRRVDDPDADPFDMRQIAWLGRTTRASTAVSAVAFRNARAAAPARGSRQYLGLGNNAPVAGGIDVARTRSPSGDGSAVDCQWNLAEWNRPISADELIGAQSVIGADRSALLTGTAFSDDAVKARSDIKDYRILHFATHGLVTAPRPQCPARPALLTSFGGAGSDGLLSFDEIFDLRIDADLVILSACDTAGAATVAATREAGLTRGGGTALDGLVRAFIGAGGRSVVASHWPVPDDYDATKRLIGGLFTAPSGTSVADALWHTQTQLMGDARTSHPYYWAGFAIVGDGTQPLLREGAVADAAPGGSAARQAN